MTFMERLWATLLALTIIFSLWYGVTVYSDWSAPGWDADAFPSYLWWMVGFYVALTIAGAVFAAVYGYKTDGADFDVTDDRDDLIDLKGERVASYGQGMGLALLLLGLWQGWPLALMAHSIVGIMFGSTLMGMAVKLWLYRKGV